MTTFVATVVILIIILVFILGSGVIKKATGNVEGIDILTEGDVGIGNILSYLPSYSKLMELKVAVQRGELLGVNYVR